ncbi:MAG: phage baseplate protein [Chloracidobacterium sp.]|nr:phage baseplate protein [Chloracidobacterium sp.]
MKPLSASELLSIWERGQERSPGVRALLLLESTASGDQSPAKLSVGRRDALLLSLRETLFGSRFVGLAACPNCGQLSELTFESSEIRSSADNAQPETLRVRAGGYEARFRLPNTEDLLAVAAFARCDTSSAAESLLTRCLIQARRKGQPVSIESTRDLPPSLLAAIGEKMEQADPQANVQLILNCYACDHNWPANFDIVSYLWSEIDDWARRILSEVYTLASAFGWREADILGMSARRRRLYMEMV